MSRVTIGLTTFNAAATIERALNSALAQVGLDFEVIAVDDGSSDGTEKFLHDIAKKCLNLRVFVNESNQGVAASRNRILTEAKGEFVAFFDDDDFSQPDRCTRQIARIKNYEVLLGQINPLVVCHTAREQHYPDGTVRIEHTTGEVEGEVAPNGLAVALRILRGDALENAYGSMATCSQMARLTTYVQVGGFDPIFRRSEDTEFNVRLALAGGHFVGISDPLVVQEMGVTSDKPLSVEYKYQSLMLLKHREIFQSNIDYEFCRRWLEVKDCWLRRDRFEFMCQILMVGMFHPIRTIRRLMTALPNISGNEEASKLHRAFRDVG